MHTLARTSASATEAERKVRIDLAAAYRLVAHFGMDDSIYTHISARVPGTHDQFLINPFGVLFKDITASSLVKIDLDGNVLEDTRYDVNPAGFVIHSAIHSARHDAACVLHAHTVSGVAVSSLEHGLEPSNQWAFGFHGRVSYHDYEGLALNPAEKQRLVADLGPRSRVLILRNHGLLTLGRTISEAFITMKNLDRACAAQLAIQSSGRPIRHVPDEIRELTARQGEAWDAAAGTSIEQQYGREWKALLRLLEPVPPTSFRD